MYTKLFEIQKILLDQFALAPFYERKLFENIQLNNRIIGIVGSRGVGKTTYLLHLIQEANKIEPRSLYVSADNIYFLKTPLIELVDHLYKETDVRLLCIDEIHKYSNWNQELKNISDTYLDFKLVFSGSSAIDIIQSKYDLSRRVTLYPFPGFSFREYLEFNLQQSIPLILLADLMRSHQQIANDLNVPALLKHFKNYLKSGYYPFFTPLKNDYEKFQAIENIAMKVIYEDIALLHSFKTPTLLTIEKLFKYILQTPPGELSVYKLAKTLEKDFESISEYIGLLQQAGLIRCLYPNKTGHAFLRNPTKIYPDNTNLLHANFVPQLETMLTGKIRETFIINQLQNSHHSVYYSDAGDFSVEQFLLEVGGPGKTTKQIKQEKNAYVLSDGILTGSHHTIPLYLFGFLY